MTSAPWIAAVLCCLIVTTGLPDQRPAMPAVRFWGEEDEEIARGGGVRLLAAGLVRRGLEHASFPGHDHEGMLAHINEAVPSLLAWFDGLPRAE